MQSPPCLCLCGCKPPVPAPVAPLPVPVPTLQVDAHEDHPELTLVSCFHDLGWASHSSCHTSPPSVSVSDPKALTCRHPSNVFHCCVGGWGSASPTQRREASPCTPTRTSWLLESGEWNRWLCIHLRVEACCSRSLWPFFSEVPGTQGASGAPCRIHRLFGSSPVG